MDRHQTALRIALSALILGVLGDALLRYIPFGMNAVLWTAAFIGAAFYTSRRHGEEERPLPPISVFAAVCAAIAAFGLVWRDSEMLNVVDVLLLLIFLPMLALGARGVRVHAAGLAELAGAHLYTCLQAVAGVPQLLGLDLSWQRAPRGGGVRNATVFARGAVLAAPPLLLFGSLLSSADDNFARIMREVFVFDFGELVLHVIATTIIAAICAGFLRSFALSGAMPSVARPTFLRIPVAEANIALALINTLFAVFVGVQFRYFFGAAPATLAEHARSGFFELVAVVALVVPMLLAVEWLTDKSRGVSVFRQMAAVQIALVFVIAASAFLRMQLYRDAFGLTEQRVYATAFMLWLAVVLLWFAATVLTGRRNRFAVGALVSGMATVVVLHAINPDAMIVHTNLERAVAGIHEFDPMYAARLSDDAAEVILANREMFSDVAFERFRLRPRPLGWRTWNLSRARAVRAIQRYESKATPPMRPGRVEGSTRESSSSRRLEISRNR
ncbi:MAG: DUF4173 domain-containing protein [Acidobacteriota bacterium]|nr:DUF4173 domain-containing protein [Acidobacteriota bacterium]